MLGWPQAILHYLSLSEVGLPSIFVSAFVGATLVPMASEPVVLAYVTRERSMFWSAVVIASIGNVLGGLVSYGLGWFGRKAVEPRHFRRLKPWFDRLGPSAMALSFLPLVGDPLCVLGGWLRLDFWRSALWMTAGKFGRYAVLTWLGLWGVDLARAFAP